MTPIEKTGLVGPHTVMFAGIRFPFDAALKVGDIFEYVNTDFGLDDGKIPLVFAYFEYHTTLTLEVLKTTEGGPVQFSSRVGHENSDDYEGPEKRLYSTGILEFGHVSESRLWDPS